MFQDLEAAVANPVFVSSVVLVGPNVKASSLHKSEASTYTEKQIIVIYYCDVIIVELEGVHWETNYCDILLWYKIVYTDWMHCDDCVCSVKG